MIWRQKIRSLVQRYEADSRIICRKSVRNVPVYEKTQQSIWRPESRSGCGHLSVHCSVDSPPGCQRRETEEKSSRLHKRKAINNDNDLRAPTNTNRFTSAIRSKMRDEIEMTSKIKHDEYWIRLQGIYIIIIIIIVCLRVLLSANVHSAVT